jgi:hypothetical protein
MDWQIHVCDWLLPNDQIPMQCCRRSSAALSGDRAVAISSRGGDGMPASCSVNPLFEGSRVFDHDGSNVIPGQPCPAPLLRP